MKIGKGLFVGMLANTSPGLSPPSSTKFVGVGPIVGIVQRKVTTLPTIDEATSPVGACTGGGGMIVSGTVGERLGRKPVLPLKSANSPCAPNASALVWSVATPLVSEAVPRDVAPSKNSTGPDGMPVLAATVAVKRHRLS